MSKHYSIKLKIISLIALISFTFTQLSLGYEGHAMSNQPQKSHLRGQQAGNANGVDKEIARAMGEPAEAKGTGVTSGSAAAAEGLILISAFLLPLKD